MNGENEPVAVTPAEGDTTDPKSPAQETPLSSPAEPQSTDPISDGNPIQEEDEAGQESPDDNDELTEEDPTKILLQAAENGDKAEVERVLSAAKVDINSYSNIMDETALHIATRNGQLELVKMLLGQPKINVDAADACGRTALHIAAEGGWVVIVQKLLEKHATINIMDEYEESALHKAAKRGHDEIVQTLLQSAVDQGETAPNSDSTANQGDGPKESVQPFDINAKNINGDTAFTLAAWKGHMKIVKLLLDRDANVDEADNSGITALAMAALEGHADVVKVLLDKKAEIDAQDNDGWTPVFFAVKGGHYEALSCLLDCENPSPNLNISTLDERTPLYEAAEKLMAENTGNGINKATEENNDTAPDDRGSTKSEDHTSILSSGQGNGISPYKRITDLLLRKIDEDGRRIELIRAASRKQEPETWRFLFDIMRSDWQRLKSEDLWKEADFVWHAANGKHDELKELLRKEANLPPGDNSKEEYTVLQWAAYLGMYVVVWKLIRNGWDSEDKRKAALDVAEERRKPYPAPTQEKPERRGNPEEKDGKPDSIPTRQPVDWKIKAKNPIPKSTERTEKDPASRIDYSITVDILKYPPLIKEAKEPVPTTLHPSRPDAFQKMISGEFFASLVHFYVRDDRVEFFRHSRTVNDVIYNKDLGPTEIMRKTIEVLPRIDWGWGQQIKYTTEKFGFRWIHLHANCTTWMKDLTHKIFCENEKGSDEKHQHSSTIKFLENSLHDLAETSPQVPYMRPWCSREKILPPDPADEAHNERSQPTTQKSVQQDLGSSNKKAQKKDTWRVALYMPYATLGWKYSKTQSDAAGNPHLWDKDNLLKKAYAGGVYQSRTLDQFYYYAAKDTEARDCDQIVTKFIDKQLQRKPDQRGEKFEILRVDQLWLWVIDEVTIISSSTHRSDAKGDMLMEGVLKHIRETQKRETANGQKPPTNVDELTKLIAWYAIRSINHPTWEKPECMIESVESPAKSAVSVEGTALNSKYSPHQMFAHQLNEMTESESRLLRRFVAKVKRRANNLKKEEEQKKREDSNAGSSVIDEAVSKGKEDQRDKLVRDGSDNNGNKGGTSEHLQAYESIHAASELLREVKDVRDELGILRFLLQQQRMVWNGLPPSHELTTSETTEATQRKMAREKRQGLYESRDITDYIDEIDEMEKTAKRIQDSIDSILGLEQNEASLIEAEEAQRLTIETMQQGKTLMVFTIVTILFLPLSFLTSLFALNVNVFPHNGDNLLYKGSWIFPILFLPAVGIFLLLVIPTFYLSRFKWSIRRIKRLMRKANGPGNDQHSSRHSPDPKTPTDSAANGDISEKKKGGFGSPQSASHSQLSTNMTAGPVHEVQEQGPSKTQAVTGEKRLNDEISGRHRGLWEGLKNVVRGRTSTRDPQRPTNEGV